MIYIPNWCNTIVL